MMTNQSLPSIRPRLVKLLLLAAALPLAPLLIYYSRIENFYSRNVCTFPRHKFASSSMVHKGYTHIPHLALYARVFACIFHKFSKYIFRNEKVHSCQSSTTTFHRKRVYIRSSRPFAFTNNSVSYTHTHAHTASQHM